MTLAECFELLAQNPLVLLIYFVGVPAIALASGLLDKGEGGKSPWKYVYSALIYMACIPGIFGFTLSLYLFLFEGQSILDTDIYTQILPIASMILTVLMIRRHVDLDEIPGFDKITALILIIFTILAILWILDRTRILVITYLPVTWVLLIFIGLLVLFVFSWRRLFRTEDPA